MINNKIIFSNLIWRFLERFGAKIVTFVVSIVLARLLDPVVYGTVAIATVVITILQVFVDSGLGNALIQKHNADDLDFSTVFYFNIVMCVVIYLLVFFTAPLLAKFYENNTLTAIIRVLGITILISGVKNVQQAYVSKHMMFKKFFFSTLGGTIVSALVGVLMAYMGCGVWSIVAQHLINLTVDTIILWITVKWRPKFMFSWKRWKTLFNYGWKLLASGLTNTVYENLRAIIIGKYYTPQDLAFYQKGEQFPDILVTNINLSIDSVLLPAMSEKQDVVEDVRAMTRKAIQISSFVIWPMMVGLAVVAEPLVSLLLTDKWLFCVPYLRVFCLIYAFLPIHTSNLNAIKAMGRSDIFFKLEIAKKIIGLAVLLSTIWFGIDVMVYCMIIPNIISTFINAFPNKKLLNYSYINQIKDILPSMLISTAMGAIVLLISTFPISNIKMLCMQIIIGIIVYVALSKIFKIGSYEYLKILAYSYLKRK